MNRSMKRAGPPALLLCFSAIFCVFLLTVFPQPLKRRNSTEQDLSTASYIDFSRVKPRKSLESRGFFHKLGEKSTDFSTGCGEVMGKTWG